MARLSLKLWENGPVRVALQITRQAQGSRFVQTIRLASGSAGNRVEIANTVDWQSQETALKAVFPLTVSNPQATYNWELGTIQRGNNDPKKFEVPSHKWFDVTDINNSYGVSVLTTVSTAQTSPMTIPCALLYCIRPAFGAAIKTRRPRIGAAMSLSTG